MKRLVAAAAVLALAGCAGTVDSLTGRSAAGSGLAASAHKQGFACPDFTAQGALQVTSMTAACSDSPTMGHTETFAAQGLDPNQALATAFTAQTANVAQLSAVLTNLLPILAKLAGVAATGGGIAAVPGTTAPIILTPPGGGSAVVIPQ